MERLHYLGETLTTALVSHAVDAIVSINSQSRVTLWNPAAEAMFGYTAREAYDADIAQLIIPPDYRGGHYQGMERLLATGQGRLLNRTTEIVALRKNGDIFPVELSLFKTEEEGQLQFTAIIRDITHRKCLEAELEQRNLELDQLLKARTEQLVATEKREKQARDIENTIRQEIELDKILQLTAQNLGEFTQSDRCVIWLFDPQTQSFKNSPYEYSRYTNLEPVAQTSDPAIPILAYALNHRAVLKIDDLSQVEGLNSDDRKMIAERGLKSLLHVPILYQNQLLGLVRAHYTKVFNSCNPEVITLVKAIADQVGIAIHHAQILETAQRNEQKFRGIFDNASYFILLLDTEGRYSDVNPSFCQFIGLPKEQIIGKKTSDIFDCSEEALFSTPWSQFANQHAAEHKEISLTIRHDRRNIILSYSAIPNFIPDSHLAVAHDITQQQFNKIELTKKSEALKRYADQLLKSNRELEQFATIASHDLQAPLRKVLIFSESLKQSEQDHLSETGRDYIHRLQNATHRMQDLITDLLALSRVTRHAQPFRYINLNQLINGIMDDLEYEIQHRQAQVIVDTLPTIEADPAQMQQLFQNLLQNALKFQQPNTPPIVHIHVLEQTETQVRIAVQDNGIGFKQEYSDKIFRVFERLHSQATYPGTGIGLAICQKIIDRHSGYIEANSTEGAGSSFVLTLPLKQSVAAV